MQNAAETQLERNLPVPGVLLYGECNQAELAALLIRYGLEIRLCSPGTDIPGSFWGDEEAGLMGNLVLARADTPLHSILHEACHYICMDTDRRRSLDTNAGGDYDEENAVCYLQILLAGCLQGVGREKMMSDMDSWGYSFRLGCTGAWFDDDAEDARSWLVVHGLISPCGQPLFRLRR